MSAELMGCELVWRVILGDEQINRGINASDLATRLSAVKYPRSGLYNEEIRKGQPF
jgi:hypothetical protein